MTNQAHHIGYMCTVDFQHHLRDDQFGARVYPDIESLRENRKCVEQCGITKVRVEFLEEVQPQKFR